MFNDHEPTPQELFEVEARLVAGMELEDDPPREEEEDDIELDMPEVEEGEREFKKLLD